MIYLRPVENHALRVKDRESCVIRGVPFGGRRIRKFFFFFHPFASHAYSVIVVPKNSYEGTIAAYNRVLFTLCAITVGCSIYFLFLYMYTHIVLLLHADGIVLITTRKNIIYTSTNIIPHKLLTDVHIIWQNSVCIAYIVYSDDVNGDRDKVHLKNAFKKEIYICTFISRI